ncbi:MAG: phosphoribosyltransferase [Candidatus Eremiobacteraeota bacterium]|nr:phosphoribosyltransferase [Candidatus Eremiobacteraeota bacterium]
MPAPFFDRHAAGVQLARALRPLPNSIVLGIARGGVIVAAAVAEAAHLLLDVIVIRKVGHPMQPELAIGAVSADGEAVGTPHAAGFPSAVLNVLFARTARDAQALEARLRGTVAALDLQGRAAIIVDDGIATSASMVCALQSARKRGAAHLTCAVPVAPAESLDQVRRHCDAVVALIPAQGVPFAVGRFYFAFQAVSDARVREALARPRVG